MRAQLNTATYYGLVKLLGTCAAGSASVAEALLAGPLVDTVKTLLTTSTLFSSATTNTASVLKSNDQLLEVRLSDSATAARHSYPCCMLAVAETTGVQQAVVGKLGLPW